MIRIPILLTSLLWACGAAAATSAKFPDSMSAEILLDNSVTRDADFLWNAMAGPSRLIGLKHVKDFRASTGKLHLRCESDRFAETRSCRVIIKGVPSGGVTIEPEAFNASLVMVKHEAAEFRAALVEGPVVQISPDEKLLICRTCNTESWLSWSRDSQ